MQEANAFIEARKQAIYDAEVERNMRLKSIYDHYRDTTNRIVNIIEMNAEIQLVEVDSKRGQDGTLWTPFLNYNPTNQFVYTMEQAMVLALAIKYDNRNTRAHEYIYKMLGMETI